MKKIYILALLAFGFTGIANAQEFTEDFEDYLDGEEIFNVLWTTWNGENDGEQNILGSTEFANSGDVSGFIGAGPGPQDAVLDFIGDAISSGTYTLTFQMYIPDGSSGYFNLQGNVDPSASEVEEFLSNNVNFVEGTMRITPGTDVEVLVQGSEEVPYPSDAWFEVTSVVDLDNATYEISVNGESAGLIPTDVTNFGGVDFYASRADNSYYVDDIALVEGTLSVEDFNADVFTVYPNPVVDVLNINSQAVVDSVVVYDVLGKIVMTANPGVASPKINMSSLVSGAYLVNVTIGDASKTIKVIK